MKLKNTKKSMLGLTTVKAFIIVLLALAIIGIVTLVILGSLNTPQMIATSGKLVSAQVANETLTAVTETAQSLSVTTLNLNSLVCSINQVYNATIDGAGSGGLITIAGNYTNANCQILALAASPYNNTNWNVTYSYNYKIDNGATGITGSVSSGIINFFTNSTTFFSLLGVVVIILIISLVIVVVNRFGGEAGGQPGTM